MSYRNLFKSSFFKRYKKMIEFHGEKASEVYIKTNPNYTHFYVGTAKLYERRYPKYYYETNHFKRKHNINQLWIRIPVAANLKAHEVEGMFFEEMVKICGKDNVRGAYISTYKYPTNRLNIINKKKNHYLNRCFKCEETGHYANKCPNKN